MPWLSEGDVAHLGSPGELTMGDVADSHLSTISRLNPFQAFSSHLHPITEWGLGLGQQGRVAGTCLITTKRRIITYYR
jgi:hypothetical protein